MQSKTDGLVVDEVRCHGSLRSSNHRHLDVLREYRSSIRNEEDCSMNITVIRRLSRFLSYAQQPTECNPRIRCFNAWQIDRHWNCSPLESKVVFIEPKRIFAILRSLFSRPVLGVSQHSIFRTGRLGWSFVYNSEWLRPAGKPHEILSDDIVQPRLLVFL
jgi:hypothetical protein